MSDAGDGPGVGPGAGGPEPVGNVGDEAAKLLGALSDWARDQTDDHVGIDPQHQHCWRCDAEIANVDHLLASNDEGVLHGHRDANTGPELVALTTETGSYLS